MTKNGLSLDAWTQQFPYKRSREISKQQNRNKGVPTNKHKEKLKSKGNGKGPVLASALLT